MTIHFRCPSCNARLGAADEQNSERGECPGCSATLIIPDPTAREYAASSEYVVAEEAPIQFHLPRESADADMDMTPMVDVTFLLLIFFMVTAAFSMQKSFQVPTPQDDRPSTNVTLQDFEENSEFVVVRIDEYSTFHITAASWDQEREAPSQQDLLVGLAEARRGSGGEIPTRLLLVAHGNALHENVVMAMDAGTEVGMTDVKLVTVEEDPS